MPGALLPATWLGLHQVPGSLRTMRCVQGLPDGPLGRAEGKGRHRSALAGGGDASGQPLDSFVNRLNQIVAADYTEAALQTPLDLCEPRLLCKGWRLACQPGLSAPAACGVRALAQRSSCMPAGLSSCGPGRRRRLQALSSQHARCAAPFPVPALASDVERNNPTLAAEFGSVMKNLKQLTTQIALLDRIHSIKVRCLARAGHSPLAGCF